MAAARRTPAKRPARRGRRGPTRLARVTAGDRIYLFALVAVLAVLAVMSLGPLQSYTAAADRVDALETTHAKLAEEVGKLEERQERLHDPEELELIAREHGLVKPGEIPFVVITPEPELDRLGPDHAAPPEPDGAWYRRLGRWLADLFDG